MDNSHKILQKLLDFYKSRYNGTELEDKFNDACLDLISTGDIKSSEYVIFCISNDIEPVIKNRSNIYSQDNDTYNDTYNGGCGGGHNYYRSGC